MSSIRLNTGYRRSHSLENLAFHIGFHVVRMDEPTVTRLPNGALLARASRSRGASLKQAKGREKGQNSLSLAKMMRLLKKPNQSPQFSYNFLY